MARSKANYEIKMLKKAMGVKWADVIKQTGLSESYFYTLLKTEMSVEYENIVRDAIMKVHSNEENAEKNYREMYNKTKNGLDLQTKKQMMDDLCKVLEHYQTIKETQTQDRPRFDISKTKKEGEDV